MFGLCQTIMEKWSLRWNFAAIPSTLKNINLNRRKSRSHEFLISAEMGKQARYWPSNFVSDGTLQLPPGFHH